MKRYSVERKKSVIQNMRPTHSVPIPRLGVEYGNSHVAQYNLRKQAIAGEIALPADGKSSEKWSWEDKFAIVLEAASLNEGRVLSLESTLCRVDRILEKGLSA